MKTAMRFMHCHCHRRNPPESIRPWCCLSAALMIATAGMTHGAVADLPLLHQADLKYVGAFRVPKTSSGGSTLGSGGLALAFNPYNNSLFITGHTNHLSIAEISIPAQLVNSSDLGKLATAALLQPLRKFTSDSFPTWALEGSVKIGGLAVADDELIGTIWEFYDANHNARNSHFRLSSLNLATANVQGLYEICPEAGHVAGYMTPVPVEWRSVLGTPYLTGQAAVNIRARTSNGPAAFGFYPGDLRPNTATPYVDYPLRHALGQAGGANPLFNGVTQITGITFIPQTRSVLFFGSHGMGDIYYGLAGDANDPYRISKGYHSINGQYAYQVWAYDALEFPQVLRGLKQPWDLRPYEVWNYDLPCFVGNKNAGGVTYDPSTQRLFVAQPHADTGALPPHPLIHVYQVGGLSPNSAPAPNPRNGAQPDDDNNGDRNTSPQSLTIMASSTGAPLGYNNPPPLPPPNPATTINAATVAELTAALTNLRSGQTISIAPGIYHLTGKVDGLYVPRNISDWAIRGASGNRNDVVIRGNGMSGSVRFGIWIDQSPHGTIADLTIDGVTDHGIIANAGVHGLLVHNVRIVDSGDQFIKSTSAENGNDLGVVEYSVFEYRSTDNDDYTNGVDVHGGDGWIIRHNLFRNILSPADQALAGPAVLMWNDSRNSVVEGNTFINVARGISLGLVDKVGGFDHQGGTIRNNLFYRDAKLPCAVDAPILVTDSPGTQVYHNTVIARGSYPNSIEYRFASSRGLDIRNNLADGKIVAREGATATSGGNVTSANLSLFVNPAAGDLHLVSGAGVIDQGVPLPGPLYDIDGQLRNGPPDVGADEYWLERSGEAEMLIEGSDQRTDPARYVVPEGRT
ncbi:MAG: right-handed parallel beta-helix repeat-containing protein [Planctomycetes bacterium]|nr:right-handed parallel beta-helix repeat-containing protein [Planctomycetota bacterium]